MMTSPERLNVAVVILNWNGIDHLKTYLPSVLAHTLKMWPFGWLTMEVRTTVWHG